MMQVDKSLLTKCLSLLLTALKNCLYLYIFAWFQCTGFLLDSTCRYWPHSPFLQVEHTRDDADSSVTLN